MSRIHPAIWVALILAIAAITITVIVVSTQSKPRCDPAAQLCYGGTG
jgi:hypothetical protein